MNVKFPVVRRSGEVPMRESNGRNPRSLGRQRGQILILTALSLIALKAAVGLLLDGGNA
jgi:hypothetical protein